MRRRSHLRGRIAAAALVAAAGLGGLGGAAGCIRAFAPAVRAEAHHGSMRPDSGRATCLKCHETESQMVTRMKAMSPAEMAAHMRWTETVVTPPLVQDWMVRDRRGCVDCHRVRGARP